VIPTQSVPEILGRARRLVEPALRSAVDRLSPELRPVAQYHLGWVDPEGRPVGGDGGKGVRPALAVLSAEAVGAPSATGVPGAVAVELVHNFSLIHDDVIDGDAERRHRPTVWALFGVGRAVIVGDALLALAQQVVLHPSQVIAMGGASLRQADAARACSAIADATAAMIAGQALDMAFESVPGVDVEGCLAMEAGKTGALLGCASAVGALLAGADPEVVAALDRYGRELGLAFQAVDDLLGIWGDPVRTGKPAWSDLRQHKKSLPVAAALASGGPQVAELADLLAEPTLDEEGIARAAALVEGCGGRAVAAGEAERRLASALAALETVPLVEAPRAELAELARFVVEREF
jgi:geranylgeranyl diphosphate synthase type I